MRPAHWFTEPGPRYLGVCGVVVPPGLAPGSCPRPGLTWFIRPPLYFELRNRKWMPMAVLPRLPRFQRAVDYFYLNWLIGGSQRACTSSRACGTDSLAGNDGTLVRFTIRMKRVAAAVVATAYTRVWAVRLSHGLHCDKSSRSGLHRH